ncbi:hypothetical protein FSOLCH5_014895 [Fusarium solani]
MVVNQCLICTTQDMNGDNTLTTAGAKRPLTKANSCARCLHFDLCFRKSPPRPRSQPNRVLQHPSARIPFMHNVESPAWSARFQLERARVQLRSKHNLVRCFRSMVV